MVAMTPLWTTVSATAQRREVWAVRVMTARPTLQMGETVNTMTGLGKVMMSLQPPIVTV